MKNAKKAWADTDTFQQAVLWLQTTLPAGRAKTPNKPKDGQVARAPSSSPTEKRKFESEMNLYKAALANNKDKSNDIFLIYDYGSNPSPPGGGKPLLFRQWEADEEVEGARTHCQKNGKCAYKKFGPARGYTAVEWVEYFIAKSEAYAVWRPTRPRWHTEPHDYGNAKLMLSNFEIMPPEDVPPDDPAAFLAPNSGAMCELEMPPRFTNETIVLKTVAASCANGAAASGPSTAARPLALEAPSPTGGQDLSAKKLQRSSQCWKAIRWGKRRYRR